MIFWLYFSVLFCYLMYNLFPLMKELHEHYSKPFYKKYIRIINKESTFIDDYFDNNIQNNDYLIGFSEYEILSAKNITKI